MIFGDPEKFAILVENVSAWAAPGFRNGLVHFIIDQKIFPDYTVLAPLDSIIGVLFTKKNALFNPPEDLVLFNMPKEEAFAKMLYVMRPYALDPDADVPDDFEDDYRYQASTQNVHDGGCYVLAVASGNQVRILGAKISYLTGNTIDGYEWKDCDSIDVYETYLTKREVLKIAKSVKAIAPSRKPVKLTR